MRHQETEPFSARPRSTPMLLACGLALAVAAASFAGCAATQPASPRGAARGQPASQAPGYYRFPLGDFQITALSDGTVQLPLDRLMSNIPAAEARKLLDAGFEKTPPEASINAFLVHTGSKLLLIDAGSGNLFGPGAGHLVANLKAAGYEPDEIDAVLITHLHKDHSGGLSTDGRRVFPNAAIYVDKADRDYRFSAEAEAKAPSHQKTMFPESRNALMPYEAAGKVVLFEAPGELFPGVRTRAAHGHTPGHTLYEVQSKGQRIIFIGDLIHSAAVQFPRPEATIAFDHDPTAAASDRATTIREVADNKTLVGAAHISFPGIGYVVKSGAEAGYRWIARPYSR